MEVLEHVAAVLGIICSFSAVFTICSKSAKAFIANMFKKYGHDENMVRIEEKLDLMNNMLSLIFNERRKIVAKGCKISIRRSC